MIFCDFVILELICGSDTIVSGDRHGLVLLGKLEVKGTWLIVKGGKRQENFLTRKNLERTCDSLHRKVFKFKS